MLIGGDNHTIMLSCRCGKELEDVLWWKVSEDEIEAAPPRSCYPLPWKLQATSHSRTDHGSDGTFGYQARLIGGEPCT